MTKTAWTCEYCGRAQYTQGVCLGCQASPPTTLSEGFLLVNGITKKQWKQALAARGSQLSVNQHHRFANIMVVSRLSPITRTEARSLLSNNSIPREWTDDSL